MGRLVVRSPFKTKKKLAKEPNLLFNFADRGKTKTERLLTQIQTLVTP